jgi:hypothetical protein
MKKNLFLSVALAICIIISNIVSFKLSSWLERAVYSAEITSFNSELIELLGLIMRCSIETRQDFIKDLRSNPSIMQSYEGRPEFYRKWRAVASAQYLNQQENTDVRPKDVTP